MRISILSNLYPPTVRGGAEISTRILAEGLRDLGAEVQVVEIGPQQGHRSHNNIPVVAVGNAHPYFAAEESPRSTLAKLNWHISECFSTGPIDAIVSSVLGFRSDVVLSQNLTGFGLRLPALLVKRLPASVPIIHTLRDYGMLCVRNTTYHKGQSGCSGQLGCTLKTAISRRTSTAYSGVVGISRFVLKEHQDRRMFIDIPQAIIHNAIDAARNDEVGVDGGNFGYLGRLSEEKGVFDLVRAYRRAARSSPRIGTLYLAGSGTDIDRRSLEELAAGLDIVFMGQVSPSDLFQKVGTLVVPSRWNEPFGRVAVEGADAGLRLIVSRSGGLPEAVRTARSDSHGVRYFDAGDEADLAQLLLDAPASKPAYSPRSSARSGLDVARDYLEFIEGVSARMPQRGKS